jgi:hypothetical protein
LATFQSLKQERGKGEKTDISLLPRSFEKVKIEKE